ncbi:Phox homologous domain-containing protein [Apodospora peruviana]|uniref:Endosomal/vacuolar adapter protein YPT35 n=1 Tax=Apodospora peruviana TaxID=516989 RepID=A0AAE0MEL9_9PEZI|nr:Phox homologous domain-containing protein [Apodospora peruviana]
MASETIQEQHPNGGALTKGESMNGEAQDSTTQHQQLSPTADAPTLPPRRPVATEVVTRAALFGESDPSEDGESDDDATTTTDGVSVVSPTSMTSPPYWVQGNHNRTVSSISAESVVGRDAITLQDNEYDDGPDGSNVYGRDRNRACWAKSVKVVDHVMVNGSATNIGAFVVWNIRVETLNGSHMNIRKRYSEFDDLRRRLVQTFPNFEAAVPVLPPKSVISKFRPRFLEKRRAGLQYFLNCILLNPEFSGSPVLKEFLFA